MYDIMFIVIIEEIKSDSLLCCDNIRTCLAIPFFFFFSPLSKMKGEWAYTLFCLKKQKKKTIV